MDPINILFGIALLISIGANFGAAGKEFKGKNKKVISKPATFLQKTPLNIAAGVILLEILGIFRIGTFQVTGTELLWLRLTGLLMFIVFSFLQVRSFKKLGKDYDQAIIVYKEQNVITEGVYKYLRHPQYTGQVLSDLGAGLALMSWLVIPVVIFIQLPLFIMRARKEEKLLTRYYPEEYNNYKKRTFI